MQNILKKFKYFNNFQKIFKENLLIACNFKHINLMKLLLNKIVKMMMHYT